MSTSISIITIVRNDATGLERTIRSVQAQFIQCFEHLIVDGASTDNTLSVARSLSDTNTRIISEPDRGIYDAMNKGAKQACGDVVGFLNAGDRYYDASSLARIREAFDQQHVDLVYGDLRFFDHADTVVRTWRAGSYKPWKVPFGWVPPHPTVYVKRRLFEEVGQFNPEYRNAGDYDWLVRVLRRRGVRHSYIPHFLADMEVGGISNGSLGGVILGFREVQEIWRSNGKPYGTIAAFGKLSSKLMQTLRT